MVAYPPELTKLANTPVLRSEMPPGYTRATITKLPANATSHWLGAVRIDFKNAHATESASYALFRDPSHAKAFARFEENINTRGVFHVAVATVGSIVVDVSAFTQTQAKALLQLALAHLQRATR
jgi:hypothetical protein